MDYIMELMHKGARIVQVRMYQYGYSECGVYEDNGNHIVEFHKDSAGVTIKSVRFTFSPKWRVIDIKKY